MKTNKNVAGGESINEGAMDNELHALFLDQLADAYDAEKQLTKALPKWIKASQSDEVRTALESHLGETEEHATRLERVGKSLGKSLERRTCQAMVGLVEEAEEIIGEKEDSSAIDAGIIAAAQKVEHYEIATYGTLCAWAKQMDHTEASNLLRETLEEEKTADRKLTEVAESLANVKAESR